MTSTGLCVTLNSRLRPAPGVLVQAVAGDLVLLDMRSEQYFGLDPVAARVWMLLADASGLEEVYATLCDEYQGDPAHIQADLLALAGQLLAAGLLVFVD